MNPLRKIIRIVSLLLFLTSCDRENPSLISLVSDLTAKQLIKTEKYEEALSLYLKILVNLPQEPKIHSNVGVLLDHLQKNDEGLKSLLLALQLAEENKDMATAFAVRFNLGVHFSHQKKITEALEHYQAALDINPSSIEVKTNIELLIQNQKQDGQGESDQKQKDGENKDNKDQNEDDKKNENKDKKEGDDKKEPPKSNPKYKPRPFKGDQLSEGDAKKILGELRNQEQKIRANFDKKESKESKNGKDW